jgi:hypothetical protein
MLAGQDDRLTRYHNIISKLSAEDEASAGGVAQGHLDWESDDDGIEPQGDILHIKEGSGEPLVGTFADAAAAAA